MDIISFTTDTIDFLGNYAYLIIILFGISHGIFDNPWSFLTMGLSLTLLPIPVAYTLLLVSNFIGSAILYYSLHYLNKRSNNYLYEKKVSKNILAWLENQPTWKHIIVIGMPLVPTIQLRLALPFTKMSLKRYLTIIIGSYLFLYTSYSLFYFGVISFITDEINKVTGIILLVGFCIFVYFGNDIRKKIYQLLNEK